MRGLIMETPLLISGIIEHAAATHGATEIVSRTIDGGLHRYTYADARARAKRLAKALLALGVRSGDRVGSLAWNTHHHFELFYGVSGTGAVLHTINPRLFEEQIAFIVNHAEDKWICFDEATLPVAQRIALIMSTADMIGGYRSGTREVVMPIAPLFHGNGWQMVYTAPMNGHKLVLPGRNFEPDKLYELMASEQVTLAAAVPTV